MGYESVGVRYVEDWGMRLVCRARGWCVGVGCRGYLLIRVGATL